MSELRANISVASLRERVKVRVVTEEGVSVYAGRPKLGRYECLLPLARGGMGEVWAARTRGARGFQKLVAIKMMLPTLLESPECEAMFLDEARIASKIQHPNVTQIFDLGEEDGKLYIAMELVDGDSLAALRRVCDGYRLPLIVALRVMADACAGLHAAHRLKDENGEPLNVVHRDVSPHNVLVSASGMVKVTDFGVAKALGQNAKTEIGSVKGKPAYMAPEQALGDMIDCRADVFAAGVVLYEITTGHHPFRGNTPIDTTTNLLTGPFPKPSDLDPSYPREIEKVVLRALDRDVDKRYQTAEELGQALLAVASQTVGIASTEDVAAFVKSCIGSVLDNRADLLRSFLTTPVRSEYASVPFVSASDVTQACPSSPEGPDSLTSSGFVRSVLQRKRTLAVLGGAAATLGVLAIVTISALIDPRAVPTLPRASMNTAAAMSRPVRSDAQEQANVIASENDAKPNRAEHTEASQPDSPHPETQLRASTSASAKPAPRASAARTPRVTLPELPDVPVKNPGF